MIDTGNHRAALGPQAWPDAPPIDSTGLIAFFDTLGLRTKDTPSESSVEDLIDELHCFGFKTVPDIDDSIDRQLRDKWAFGGKVTIFGVFRDVMLYRDIDLYFRNCLHGQWRVIDESSYYFLVEKYGEDKVSEYISYDRVAPDDD